MLRGFLRRLRPPPTSGAPAVPPGTRVYAVGDVHGELGALTRLMANIREDAAESAAERRVLVFLGDYVDRGLDSRAVIDFLLAPSAPGFKRVFLRGNHEAWMLAFLADARAGPQWLEAGGQATLLSYGVTHPPAPRAETRFEALREALARALPAEHVAFLEGLELHHVEGDYAFVHAGIRPGIALADQSERDLLWIRDEFIHDRRDHGKVIVHGHSLTHRPEVLPNRIGIDTGAYATGCLTCLVLAGTDRRFLYSAAAGPA